MTAPDPETVAAGLTREQREAWIRTVLVAVGSEPQRRAFIAGYAGNDLPDHPSTQMRDNYKLGLAVRALLERQTHD